MRPSRIPTLRSRRPGRAPGPVARRLAVGTLATVLVSLLWPVPSAPAAAPPGPAPRPADAGFVGHWEGSLSVGRNELRIVFHIREDDGELAATLDSPDQAALGIPVESTSARRDSLRLEIRAAGAVYVGRLAGDGQTIEGEWRQAGTTIPLTLERTEEGGPADEGEERRTRRPQEPEPPLPYAEEAVRIDVPGSDLTLAGTLTLPPGHRAVPAVVLVSGCGPQDRDGTLAGHRPFLVLADHLARRGIAVLRTDDPGVGGSTGSTFDRTLEDRAAEVLAAVRLLRERPGIHPERIGVLGHSEGGWVVSLAATRGPEAIGFVVLMAGPAQSPEGLLLSQQRALLVAGGAADAKIAARGAFLGGNLDVIRSSRDAATARSRLLERRTRILEELPEDERAALEGYFEEQTDAEREQALWVAGTPWFRHLLTFDAERPLRTMDQPALAVFGSNDLQVPVEENVPAMERLLETDRRADRTVRVLAGLNHLFQPGETGLPGEYGEIETTLAPAALEAVSGWIARAVEGRLGDGG